MERLVLLVRLELLELRLVGVADDDGVNVGLREAGRLDHLLLRHGDQHVVELDVALQDLDVLDEAPVGDLQLPVEAVAQRVPFPVLRDAAEVHVPDELRDVLVLGVGGLERPDTDPRALAQADLDDGHVLPLVVALPVAVPLVVGKPVAAYRAQVPFDPHPQELLELQALGARDQVQRLLVHGAALDCIQGNRVLLESLFQQGHDGGLAGRHRTNQDEDPLARLRAVGAGTQEAHQIVEDLLDAEDLPGEEVVLDLVLVVRELLEPGDLRGSLLQQHVEDPARGELRDLGVDMDQAHVVPHGSFPGTPLAGLASAHQGIQ